MIEQNQLILIGCYTDKDSEIGIYLYEFISQKKTLKLLSTANIPNASYITAFRDGSKTYIYSVNENHTISDEVTSLCLDIESNFFEDSNKINCKGADPCHISLSFEKKHLFVSNYSDGSLSVISINNNFSVETTLQNIKHKISSEDKSHKTTHIHSAIQSLDGKFLLVANLGLDTITVYKYNSSILDTPIDPIPNFILELPFGTGPRHTLYSYDGNYLYVVGELDATLHVLEWDNGHLKHLQCINLMPDEYNGTNSAADLHLSQDGKFLYVSNRGSANQIIILELNNTTGLAKFVDRVNTNGIGPRNFALDPNGNFMLIAHQRSNDVRLFQIDKKTGMIKVTDFILKVNSPVFIKFI